MMSIVMVTLMSSALSSAVELNRRVRDWRGVRPRYECATVWVVN